jgi:hypothetical protein
VATDLSACMARTHNWHSDSDDLLFGLSHMNGFHKLSAIVPLGFFANGLASIDCQWEEVNHSTEKNKKMWNMHTWF